MVPVVASHLDWSGIHFVAVGIAEDLGSVPVSVGTKVAAAVQEKLELKLELDLQNHRNQ